MQVECVYRNDCPSEINFPKAVLPSSGIIYPHHFKSTPQDNLIELAGRVCYPYDVQVLTRYGWCDIGEYVLNQWSDELMTFNLETKELEYQKPTEYIQKEYSDYFVEVDERSIKMKTTKDHNWVVKNESGYNLIKAENLTKKFAIERCGIFNGQRSEYYTIPSFPYHQRISNQFGSYGESKIKYTKSIQINDMASWAEFLGYFFSEGCVNNLNTRSGINVKIYQKEPKATVIRKCLEKLQFNFSEFLDKRQNVIHFTIYCAEIGRYLSLYGRNSAQKSLPIEIFDWSLELREILLDALMFGDGTQEDGKYRIYTTNSKQLADDVQRLITTANRTGTISYLEKEKIYRVRECATTEWNLNTTKDNSLFKSPSSENEMVYCVSVPNKTLLVRYKNSIMICGNCYDSAKSEKSRGSEDYHKHINEVNHGSVQEHVNITISFTQDFGQQDLLYWCTDLLNRPGVSVYWEHGSKLRVTTNIRAIREWTNNWQNSPPCRYDYDSFGVEIQRIAKELCPLAMGSYKECLLNPRYLPIGKLELPTLDDEIWISYYLAGISRGLTHELVRHKFRTAISQRSTRYVDESESDWAWHPLIHKYDNEIVKLFLGPNPNENTIDILSSCPRHDYEQIVNFLNKRLIENGLDKFTARKQARGAARGILGNALSTELIFSASLAQWKRIILQRCNDAADAEIRLMCSKVFDDLKSKYPERFSGFEVRAASDGFGYHVQQISN